MLSTQGIWCNSCKKADKGGTDNILLKNIDRKVYKESTTKVKING